MRILRGLGGRLLECGCLVGLYETYDHRTVAILDARDRTCTDPGHLNGAVITLDNLELAPVNQPRDTEDGQE